MRHGVDDRAVEANVRSFDVAGRPADEGRGVDDRAVEANVRSLKGDSWHAKGMVAAHGLLMVGQHIVDGTLIGQRLVNDVGVEARPFCGGAQHVEVFEALFAPVCRVAHCHIQLLDRFVAALPAGQRQRSFGGPASIRLEIRRHAFLAVHHFQAEETPVHVDWPLLARLAYPQGRAPRQRTEWVKVKIDGGRCLFFRNHQVINAPSFRYSYRDLITSLYEVIPAIAYDGAREGVKGDYR